MGGGKAPHYDPAATLCFETQASLSITYITVGFVHEGRGGQCVRAAIRFQ